MSEPRISDTKLHFFEGKFSGDDMRDLALDLIDARARIATLEAEVRRLTGERDEARALVDILCPGALDSGGGEGEKASADTSATEGKPFTSVGDDGRSLSRPPTQTSSPGDAPKTGALFTPEILDRVSRVEFESGFSAYSDDAACDDWHVEDAMGNRVASTLSQSGAIQMAFELSRGGAKPSPPRTEGR